MNDRRKGSPILSASEIAAVVLIVFPIFLFFGGPIWTHAFQIDGAVGWSYVPIPALVALLLLRRSAFTFGGFVASTVHAAGIKYALTAMIALGLWIFTDPPPLTQEAPPYAYAKLDGDRTSAEPNAFKITVSKEAFTPSSASLEIGQAVAFVSEESELHTVRARNANGRIVFNYPLIPGRTSPPVVLKQKGRLELSCTVHPDESRGLIIVSASD